MLRLRKSHALIAVFGLTMPIIGNGTQPLSCTLYVKELKEERVKDWEQLGYQVIEKKDINSLPAEKAVTFLDASHFILYRDSAKSEFWFSTTQGKSSYSWRPLSFPLPASNQPLSKEFNCASIRNRVDFYTQIREAIQAASTQLRGQSTTQTVGSIFLDLERAFFYDKRAMKFATNRAKSLYSELLQKAVKLREASTGDFYQDWAAVRKLVYHKSQSAIHYCQEKASMTEALVDKCTNCVGETFLLAALFQDAHFPLPSNMQFGIQMFTDHLRPIAYNLSTKRTYDFATGQVGRFKAAILNAETLMQSLLMGDAFLRSDSERVWASSVSPRYVYRNWGCYNPLSFEIRASLEPADFSRVYDCDRFF